jgi:GNAT superfamily N-acetyltransferase
MLPFEGPGATGGPRLRRLGAADLPEIERHLLGLDLVDRNARFHSGFGDAAVTTYARGLDFAVGILVGATQGPGNRILGLAEAHPAGAPRTVELAVSVLATHRRRGLGRRLLAHALELAFAAGADTAELRCSPGNRHLMHIAMALGAPSELASEGRAVIYNCLARSPGTSWEPLQSGIPDSRWT